MKKLLFFFLTLTFTITAVGAEYRNLNIGFNTYETRLATSEDVVPVYTEIKYTFNKASRVSPFIRGNLGFSYVDDVEESSSMMDMTSNPYYSMGTGVDIGHLTMEAAYVTYQVAYADSEDASENRVTLKVKYRY